MHLGLLVGLMLCVANVIVPAVARIALVKPDKARGVEDIVLRMAQRGQITEKVGCDHHGAST